jgi:Flp pilus assembly protein TadG
MRVLKRRRLNRAGATMVVAAVMILMFLSIAALAIDYGMVKTAKAEAQRAMDGAALAGASAFTEPDPNFPKRDSAIARANALAVKHTVHRVVVDTTRMTVDVDPAAETVIATYSVPPMALWFARRFGSSTMGLTATATAHAENSSLSTCVKPVAIPDAWNNASSSGEDLNGDQIWNYQDKPGGTPGVWDEGEIEPWAFNGSDSYDSTTTGWGTNFRGSSDYGRQIFVQSFGTNDDPMSSFYYSWGKSPGDNGASKIAQRILGSCETAELQKNYVASNGSKTNQISDAWDELIDRDPNAVWNNSTNSVDNSNKGANWLDQSARVIAVGLYNPSAYSGCPSCNNFKFNNMARVFLDKRACPGNGSCTQPLTGHFLGLVGGGGPGGTPSGSLVKKLVLIK